MGSLIDYDDIDFDSFLTNQKLSDFFNSRFDLVLFAIAASKKAVSEGQGKVVVGNLSYEVIKDLYQKSQLGPVNFEMSRSRKVVSKSDKRSNVSKSYKSNIDTSLPDILD